MSQLPKVLLSALTYPVSATLDMITPPQSDNPCGGYHTMNVSSVTSSGLTGLVIGSAVGLLLVIACAWAFSRYVERVTAKVRRLKQRLRIMVQMVVLGIYLFGPPLFAGELRDEEPNDKGGNEKLEANRDLVERRERTGPSERRL